MTEKNTNNTNNNESYFNWLESQLHHQVSIWCEDPEANSEKIAGGVLGEKTYLTYRINYKQMGRDLITTRHRYSEFENLRNDLRDRYHPLGILVPSLPPKNTIASLTSKLSLMTTAANLTSSSSSASSASTKNPYTPEESSFVKERTLGLTLFCESIIASPWLRNDPQWKSFCLPPQQRSSLKPNEGGGGGGGGDLTLNTSEAQLLGCLQQLEIPYKFTMTQRMEDIREEIKTIESHAKFLLEKARTVQSTERALQQANEQLKRGLENWFDAERIHVKSLGGRIFDEHEPVIQSNETIITSVIGLNGVVTSKTNTGEENPHFIGLTLIALLEHELSMVESFKELLKIHEEMIKEIENLSTKINKLESNKSSKFDSIQENRRLLDEKNQCLMVFYKGFVFFTLPFIARQRASYTRRFFSGYVCSQMSNSYILYKTCQEFFGHLILPIKEVAEESSKMLELLKIKPMAKVPLNESEGNDVDSVNKLGGNVFMSSETDGLNGLFNRALVISKKKPIEKSTQNAATLVSQLYNDSIAPNPPSSAVKEINSSLSASNDAPVLPPTPVGVNPLAARRGSAILRSAEKTNPKTAEKPAETPMKTSDRLEPIYSPTSPLSTDAETNYGNTGKGSAFMTPVNDDDKSPVPHHKVPDNPPGKLSKIWDDA